MANRNLTNDGLSIIIIRADTGAQIAKTIAPVNIHDWLVSFSLAGFLPSFKPYQISLEAIGVGGLKYATQTQLYHLPSRTDGGSVTKIDNLYGALLVQSPVEPDGSSSWIPLLPYSFYLDGSWLGAGPSRLVEFASYGYNVLHIIPGGGIGYDFELLDGWLDEAEKLGLWIMFDMRHTYQVASDVTMQVNRLKARKNMLLWYTGDEPDGHGDPLTSTRDSYNLIKSLDPYHPVSLCLNCENYHFQEYSAGTDIILSDVYPVGTNTSWSSQYDTVCNSTYGCCGCDNCRGFNNLTNVAARLDTWQTFQTQLGIPLKALWATPQAFGASEFWKQTPTAEEEAVMTMLSINHGAKGIVMWTFPTTDELTDLTSRLGKVLRGECARFILGAKIMRGLLVSGGKDVDVSAWRTGNTMLLSVVNPMHQAVAGPISVSLPSSVQGTEVVSTLWGDGMWKVEGSDTGRQLVRNGMEALEVDLLILKYQRAILHEEACALAEAS
ncbi:MAG: hypothetical protein Q9217_002212 [Psora testacea]